MKAKLGNEIVEYWQISLTNPANESWVLEGDSSRGLVNLQ